MQRNFKLVLSIIVVLLSGALAFGQEDKVEYKDVILDGKPAKLNVKTGEVTLINAIDNKKTKATKIITNSKRDSTLSNSDFHIVKEGETLLEIASQYNSSLIELKKANNLKTTLVDKGQKLRVKNFDKIKVVESIPKPDAIVNKNNIDFHIVERGNTLYSLSKWYNLTVDELKRINGLNSDLILIGQELKVSKLIVSNEAKNLSTWKVSKGDTLYSIAKKNGLTVQHLKSLNNLTSNLIKVDQVLRLK